MEAELQCVNAIQSMEGRLRRACHASDANIDDVLKVRRIHNLLPHDVFNMFINGSWKVNLTFDLLGSWWPCVWVWKGKPGSTKMAATGSLFKKEVCIFCATLFFFFSLKLFACFLCWYMSVSIYMHLNQFTVWKVLYLILSRDFLIKLDQIIVPCGWDAALWKTIWDYLTSR